MGWTDQRLGALNVTIARDSLLKACNPLGGGAPRDHARSASRAPTTNTIFRDAALFRRCSCSDHIAGHIAYDIGLGSPEAGHAQRYNSAAKPCGNPAIHSRRRSAANQSTLSVVHAHFPKGRFLTLHFPTLFGPYRLPSFGSVGVPWSLPSHAYQERRGQ